MSGIASSWGYSPQMVVGIDNNLDYNGSHLTGQLGMTSTPVTFNGYGNFVSPLIEQNKSFYNFKPSFGNALKKLNQELKYLKRI